MYTYIDTWINTGKNEFVIPGIMKKPKKIWERERPFQFQERSVCFLCLWGIERQILLYYPYRRSNKLLVIKEKKPNIWGYKWNLNWISGLSTGFAHPVVLNFKYSGLQSQLFYNKIINIIKLGKINIFLIINFHSFDQLIP